MTLLARNEADIIDAQIAFHLSAGVDLIVATDNRSDDGTLEIFERWERTGRLHLIREPGDDMRQAEWVTSMARFAATELRRRLGHQLRRRRVLVAPRRDAERRFETDSGEIRRRARLLEALPAAARGRSGLRGTHDRAVCASRHSRGQADDLSRPPEGGAPGRSRRRDRGRESQRRRYRARAVPSLAPDRGPSLLTPLRGAAEEQESRRLVESSRRRSSAPSGPHERGTGRPGARRVLLPSHVVDDEALARGLAEGRLAIDTRLRDALRVLRGPSGSFDVPAVGAPSRLAFPAPDVAEAGAFAAEASSLVEIDGIVRAESRVDALERRLDSLEATGFRRRVARRAERPRPRRRLARP